MGLFHKDAKEAEAAGRSGVSTLPAVESVEPDPDDVPDRAEVSPVSDDAANGNGATSVSVTAAAVNGGATAVATNGASNAAAATVVSRSVPLRVSSLPPPPPWAPVVLPEPNKKAAHPWRRRILAGVGACAAIFVAVVAVFDRVQADNVLPGVEVDGIAVGGLSRDDATAKLQEFVSRANASQVTVKGDTEEMKVSLADLGLRADIDASVDKALQGFDAGEKDGGFGIRRLIAPFRRTYHRVFDKEISLDVPVEYAFDDAKVTAFLTEAQQKIDRPAIDTKIDVSTGKVRLTPSQTGRALDTAAAQQLLTSKAREWALARKPVAVELPVAIQVPARTEATIGKIIFVNRGTRTLELYDGPNLVKTYRIAVGTPGFPTPKGEFKIVEKRKNPTWVNPAPNGWGAGMPARIGPGPSNPLGTRALNLNASGIRIHGTNNVGSIGTAASHGCMRMVRSDVEDLFERVEVGTPVIII
jgi:lipoprotein-anchoring transpeptidase ErfK/SrfK